MTTKSIPDRYKPGDIETKWPRRNLTSRRRLPASRSRGAILRGKQRLHPAEYEPKWQKFWEKIKLYAPDIRNAKKPYYNLMMFPYPSAEGLHIGNMYAFTGVDIHGRFMRMRGYDVFEPIGLDGFGIHSENYALKVNKHPKEQAKTSEANFYRQLHAIGNMFDWSRTVETYDPDYYRWTQWLFVQMFKHGLAYRAKAEVNWCPSCKTVLADEQVVKKVSKVPQVSKVLKVSNVSNVCERCGSEVERKELEQWFFKITKYAERLLQNTYKPSFNWPEKVKLGQRNWIGKKEGININYPIIQLSNYPISKKTVRRITCFTTRPDTNFGATFIVISPEHPHVLDLSTKKQLDIVKEYIKQAQNKSDDERRTEGRTKTGVFTGSFAINQLNDEKLPIYVADFVLMGVGTGAVIGVPGHDKRDFEFAQAMDLPVKRVVIGPDGDTTPITKTEQVQEESGKMVNSGFLNGFDIQKSIKIMTDYLEEKGWGKRITTYHLRDWLISRQRYWGAPIPMIYCSSCAKQKHSWFSSKEASSMLKNSNNQAPNPKQILNTKQPNSKQFGIWNLEFGNSMRSMVGWYPVPEDQLPVLLPDVADWKPTGTGRGPLAGHPEFYQTKCPYCGSPAERETDVCDTFLDSSWYYLRYPSVGIQKSKIKNQNELEIRNWKLDIPWDPEITRRWLPVHSYIGGAEHTVLHLLYARFVWMALKDFGLLEIKNQKSKIKNTKEGKEVKLNKLDNFDPDEPFRRFFTHGLIIKDGAKMSKSKGNVVVPDDYIKLYGADALRTYLMFLGPFDGGGDFRDSGIAGMYKWLSRVWRLSQVHGSQFTVHSSTAGLKRINNTIKAVTEDMEELGYNTAIARLMEFTNWWMEQPQNLSKEMVIDFLKLISPFAPHMSEELFQLLRNDQIPNSKKISNFKFESIHTQSWPRFDPELVKEEKMTVVVQVNGKLRDVLTMAVQSAKDQHQVEQLAKSSAKATKWLQDKKIIKTIFVPGKLINFVIT